MTTLHKDTFDYLSPTEKQRELLFDQRAAAAAYAAVLERVLPDGPDKTYTLRKLRDVAMWAGIAITRYPDGSPRPDDTPRMDPGEDAGAFARMDGKK